MKVIESKTIYRGKVFNVRIDQLQPEVGKKHQIDLLEHQPAVTMIPVDSSGQIWFVRQYRHPVGAYLLELPAGVMEPGESPENSAQRELREEIGMRAENLERIAGFYLAPGYSTEYMHIFLANQLEPDPLPGDIDENIEIVKIPISQVGTLIEMGEIRDAKSLSALFLAQGKLGAWQTS